MHISFLFEWKNFESLFNLRLNNVYIHHCGIVHKSICARVLKSPFFSELEFQLCRFQRKCDELEIMNKKFAAHFEQMDSDKKEICDYLRKSLQQRGTYIFTTFLLLESWKPSDSFSYLWGYSRALLTNRHGFIHSWSISPYSHSHHRPLLPQSSHSNANVDHSE